MIYKLLFIFSIAISLFNDIMVKKYLSNLDILTYLFLVNLISSIVLFVLYAFMDINLLTNYYKKRPPIFFIKKFHKFFFSNMILYQLSHVGIPRFNLMILGNIILLFNELFSVFMKTKVIIFRSTTIIRAFISIVAQFLIFSEFNNSKITQITGAYYAIPIGDFLYTNSRTNSIVVMVALSLLVGVILSKDIIYAQLNFMRMELFGVSLFYILIAIIISGLLVLYRSKKIYPMIGMGICGALGLMGMYILLPAIANYQVVNVSVHLLTYCISIFGVLTFLFRRSTGGKLINFVIIGFNILILLLYEAKVIAIVGSICYSAADILIQKYASHTKSEIFFYSLSVVIVLFPVIAIKGNYNPLELLMINSDLFPNANISWIHVWLTSLFNIIIQFALVTCFYKYNLNTYLPFRYIDLIVSGILDRQYILSVMPTVFSLLFAYFI